jgi:hypothetical protein
MKNNFMDLTAVFEQWKKAGAKPKPRRFAMPYWGCSLN